MKRWHLGVACLAVAAGLIALAALDWPSFPPPPAWLDRLARDVVRRVLPVLYWSGGLVFLAIWEVLRWQRNDPETAAARWNRRLKLSFAVLLLLLAMGRTLLRDWLAVGFAAGFLLATFAVFAMGIAMVVTYVWPAYLCRGGRCEVVAPNGQDGVLPAPPATPWDGTTERRTGPPDRRRKPWPGDRSNLRRT